MALEVVMNDFFSGLFFSALLFEGCFLLSAIVAPHISRKFFARSEPSEPVTIEPKPKRKRRKRAKPRTFGGVIVPKDSIFIPTKTDGIPRGSLPVFDPDEISRPSRPRPKGVRGGRKDADRR